MSVFLPYTLSYRYLLEVTYVSVFQIKRPNYFIIKTDFDLLNYTYFVSFYIFLKIKHISSS